MTEFADMTAKQQKIVKSFWKLRRENNGRNPTNVSVAEEAYDTCSDEYVRQVKKKFKQHFIAEPMEVQKELSEQTDRSGEVFAANVQSDGDEDWAFLAIRHFPEQQAREVYDQL